MFFIQSTYMTTVSLYDFMQILRKKTVGTLPVKPFSKGKLSIFLDALIQKIYICFLIVIIINIFRGDLTDVLSKKASLHITLGLNP